MNTSHALVTVTDLGPSKLLQRLAKHWAHKFEVESDESHAVIPFPTSRCELQVRDSQLLATLQADDADTLAKMQDVVGDHLSRMARGEALVIDWRPGADVS